MRLTIFHNAVRGMRVLFDATRKLGIPLENPDKNGVFGSQLLLLDNVAAAVNEGNFRDFRPLLQSLWSDAGIRAAYDRRSIFQERICHLESLAPFDCSWDTLLPCHMWSPPSDQGP